MLNLRVVTKIEIMIDLRNQNRKNDSGKIRGKIYKEFHI